jgi:hypothetical protein
LFEPLIHVHSLWTAGGGSGEVLGVAELPQPTRKRSASAKLPTA